MPQRSRRRPRRSIAWRRTGRALAIATVAAACIAGGIRLLDHEVDLTQATYRPAPLPAEPFAVAVEDLAPVAPFGTSPASPSSAHPTEPDGRAATIRASDVESCGQRLRPSTVAIPSLCAFGPLVSTSDTIERELTIPHDVREVGMWDRGAPLFDDAGRVPPAGTTLLAGHVNARTQGPGTLHLLYRVRPGAVVYVADAAGRATRWRITRIEVRPKGELPPGIFHGHDGPRQLALVTCGGPVLTTATGRHTYADNVVAIAVPG